MKYFALALMALLTACVQVGPVIDEKHDTIECCAVFVEYQSTLFTASVNQADRSVSLKASRKF